MGADVHIAVGNNAVKLPLECDVEYHKGFLTRAESGGLFDWILDNCKQDLNDGLRLADGSIHRTGTSKLMFVDRELVDYSLLHESFGSRLEWPSIVAALRDRVEGLTGIEFSVCVCIYYVNGGVGIDFHSDLPAFGPVSVIPSLSLGQARELVFRRKSDHSDQFRLELEDGSLLVVGDRCQANYEHSLPINPDYQHPRINLTFRAFDWPGEATRRRRTT